MAEGGGISVYIGYRGAATVIAVAAVAVAAVLTPVITGGGGAATANLWIDANGGTCTRSSSPAAYSDAAACPPLTTRSSANQAAILNASSGDTIMIRNPSGGDDYGKVVFGFHTKDVTIRGEDTSGTMPEFSSMVTSCGGCTVEHVKFENRASTSSLTADDVWVCEGPNPDGRGAGGDWFTGGIVNTCAPDFTLSDYEIDGLQIKGSSGNCPDNGIEINGLSTDITFSDGSIHGVHNAKDVQGGADGWTLEYTHMYDSHRGTECDPDVHNECVWTGTASNATFRGNIFEDCPTGQGLSFLGTCTNDDNVLIENNVFMHSMEGSDDTDWSNTQKTLFIAGGACRIQGWVVRYNTFETAPVLDTAIGTGTPKGEWYGNIGNVPCSSSHFNYSYNVGETCSGANSVSVSPSDNTEAAKNQITWYTNAPAGDFTLTSGSAPIGAGDPSRKPTLDAAGCTRGNPPDAGAYEFGGC